MTSALRFYQLSALLLHPCACPSCKMGIEEASESLCGRTWTRGYLRDLHFSPISSSFSLQEKKASSALDVLFMMERTQTRFACFS